MNDGLLWLDPVPPTMLILVVDCQIHALGQLRQSKKVKNTESTQNISLGPQVREGENVFGVAHIFASFNDTFVVCSESGNHPRKFVGAQSVENDRDGLGIEHLWRDLEQKIDRVFFL